MIAMTRRREAELKDEYHLWLCELIGVDRISKTYWKLAGILSETLFIWSVPNDDNRGFEGKALRERFCMELDIEFDEFDEADEECNMLELIIAIAYRCEALLDQDDKPMEYFFWEMMINTGLAKYDDVEWALANTDYIVEEILNKINNRYYERNGVGSLFPMKYNKKDMRKVELWYQMQWYMVENYYTD